MNLSPCNNIIIMNEEANIAPREPTASRHCFIQRSMSQEIVETTTSSSSSRAAVPQERSYVKDSSSNTRVVEKSISRCGLLKTKKDDPFLYFSNQSQRMAYLTSLHGSAATDYSPQEDVIEEDLP